jgi:drug/metabolite transporter (DMT)-like permease
MRLFMHKSVHGVLTAIMAYLAFTFMDGQPTFNVRAWDWMAAAMSEDQWGICCALVAAVGVATMFTDNWKVRAVAAVILSTMHTVVAILIFMGNPHGPGSGLFLGYAVLGALLAYSTAHIGQRVTDHSDATHFQGPLAR